MPLNLLKSNKNTSSTSASYPPKTTPARPHLRDLLYSRLLHCSILNSYLYYIHLINKSDSQPARLLQTPNTSPQAPYTSSVPPSPYSLTLAIHDDTHRRNSFQQPLSSFLSSPLTAKKKRKHESRKSNNQKSSSTRQIKLTKAISEKKYYSKSIYFKRELNRKIRDFRRGGKRKNKKQDSEEKKASKQAAAAVEKEVAATAAATVAAVKSADTYNRFISSFLHLFPFPTFAYKNKLLTTFDFN